MIKYVYKKFIEFTTPYYAQKIIKLEAEDIFCHVVFGLQLFQLALISKRIPLGDLFNNLSARAEIGAKMPLYLKIL